MKGIRGRYGQMKVLETELDSTVKLLDTTIFNKDNFYNALGRQQDFIIRPLLGPQKIRVNPVNNSLYIIESTNNKQHFTNSEDVYEHLLKHEFTKKNYVIQTVPANNQSVLHYHRFTLHRISSSSNWKVVHHSITGGNELGKIRHALPFLKFNKVVRNAANLLGNYYLACNTIVIEILQNKMGETWITDTILHERNSKWSQFHSLYSCKALRSYIPHTELCTKESLGKFLQSLRQVVLKPCVGQQGKGIVKVTKLDDNTFEIHENKQIININDFAKLYDYIHNHYLSKNDYIVQQFIVIGKIDDRLFDVRVMSQLDETEWIITGVLVKVATKGFFISNRASQLLTLEEALIWSNSKISFDKCVSLINEICGKASVVLEKNCKGITIIGFDIAIDSNGALWIIEGNYAPSTAMFYKFKYNEMYETIYKYINKNKKRFSPHSD
ncbi:YheC/YheD family protein [Sporosarcina highlanderae]|uniref:YheC/YheD family protein n=1 Tax=Sporosarcina highlanderae TaxID=3035916 RepID=A0ABT8JR11_9BACL|nr:YheC/YheD family protein [Sporosarcina highlanderae]MDN4607593.1 YheC/YheD family protein [Sporosarcina highlanderae]